MIIKIEDLPSGQIIKDISVNVSFENGQIKEIKQSSGSNITSNEYNTIVTTNQQVHTISEKIDLPHISEPNSIIPEIDLSKREHKIDFFLQWATLMTTR
jgi:hypothetical protein